jgi:DNA-binding winged helix-turn-helix (wHTH) protein
LSEDCSIDLENDLLYFRGEVVDLDHRPFAMLKFLYEHSPAWCPTKQILDLVWNDAQVEENNVHQAATQIRQVFERYGIESIGIEGKRRHGYRLILPELAKRQAREAIERASLTETHLRVIGISGSELWNFPFPAPVRLGSPEEHEWRIQRTDLLGDGDIGVLAAIRFRESGPPDTLYYLSSDGTLRWSLEAAPDLMDRGGKSFERAWRFTQLVVIPTSRGNEAWVSLANEAGWAGCVLRVDCRGNAMVQFANSGFVERISTVTTPTGERYVIVAGETNAYEQAFVALLGVDDPPSRSAPGALLPRYRYENAPVGYPRKYIRFPKTELIMAEGRPYGHVRNLPVFPGRVIVEVETGERGASFRYQFSELLRPEYVFPSGSHEFRHRALEEEKKLAHAWKECPELAAPLRLEIWEPTIGWYSELIPWRDNPWTER